MCLNYFKNFFITFNSQWSLNFKSFYLLCLHLLNMKNQTILFFLQFLYQFSSRNLRSYFYINIFNFCSFLLSSLFCYRIFVITILTFIFFTWGIILKIYIYKYFIDVCWFIAESQFIFILTNQLLESLLIFKSINSNEIFDKLYKIDIFWKMAKDLML